MKTTLWWWRSLSQTIWKCRNWLHFAAGIFGIFQLPRRDRGWPKVDLNNTQSLLEKSDDNLGVNVDLNNCATNDNFHPQSVPQSCAPGSRQVCHITQASCLFLIIIIMMIIPNYPSTQPLSFWVTQETPRNVENLLSVHFYFLLTQLVGNSIFLLITTTKIVITTTILNSSQFAVPVLSPLRQHDHRAARQGRLQVVADVTINRHQLHHRHRHHHRNQYHSHHHCTSNMLDVNTTTIDNGQ